MNDRDARFFWNFDDIEIVQPEPSAKAAPIPDTTELVAALRSATEALLHGQPE